MGMRDTFNTIVNRTDARGTFLGGIISGTPKPGTIMQIKAATEPVAGKFTFEAFSRDADGDRPKGPIMVLCEDWNQGKTIDDAYADGKWGMVYIPREGDEMLCLYADVAGTGDSHAIGELAIVKSGTGKLIVTTGTPESEPFVLLETLAALTADTLAHTMFTGH